MRRNIPDGTYILKPFAIEDYASKWSYGYIVGYAGVVLRRKRLSERKLRSIARRLETRRIGVWRENGRTYVNAWIHIPDRRTALELAIEGGQVAIYDLRFKRAIYT